MSSSSNSNRTKDKARRWVLQSPRREMGEGEGSLVGDDITKTGGAAPRVDGEPLLVSTDSAPTSRRSRSPLSRLRHKLSVSIGIVKRSPRYSSTTQGKPRSKRGAGSTHTSATGQQTQPVVTPGDGTSVAAEDMAGLENGKEDAKRCLSALRTKPSTTSDTRESGGRSFAHAHYSCEAGQCDDGEKQNTGAYSAPGVEREASCGRSETDVGEHVLSVIKAGKQAPRIAFIGVFLNGVAVGLATFVPFGGCNARMALVKEVLLKPSVPVLPGGCYTARGSALAVHVIVDHKHRVYACISAADVPFSLGLSLLEEVQIEYISTVSTLAFSTKENSHSTRCHAQMARSWAKYEGVERGLARERETRRLLGEDPLDIESPPSRDSKGAQVTPLHFTTEHQAALVAAAQEISSLERAGETKEITADVAYGDDSSAAAAIRKHSRNKTRNTKFLAAGAAVTFVVLYAARRANVSF